MAKSKLNQSQRRKLRKAKAAATALAGPPAAPTTGPRDAAIHRVIQPSARGQRSGVRKQVEMVIRHYHFHQQAVAGCTFIPSNIIGGQNMSVPPPATILSKPKVVQSHPRVVQSHPKVLTPTKGHSSNKGPKPQHPSVLKANKTVVRVRSDKPVLTLWGSSHLAKNQLLGLDLDLSLGAHFQRVINLSEGGAKLTNELTERIETEIRSHPGPNQVYVILFGGNNKRKTTKPILEVAKVVSRFRRIMIEAQKAKIRVLLCGTIPDPRPAVDSKLKLLDEALKDLDMGQGNNFLSFRGMMLNSQGQLRKELYKLGDIHLSEAGVRIVSLRIQTMLNIMLPAPVPVQAPAVQAPTGQPPVATQLLVAVVVQHVAVVQDQVESPMEIEDEDTILQKLFFKKFGCALPEMPPKRSEVDDINMDLIDLTGEPDEMDATPALAPVLVVVKTEPIDTNPNAPTAANVASARAERKGFDKFAKSAKFFAKKLAKANTNPNPNPTPKRVRKIRVAPGVNQVIPEKEAPAKGNEIVVTNSNESKAAEFEKDLIGIYAGPIRTNVVDVTKDVTKENDTNDASMDDAPSNDD
jgi:hypothetical protein